jgi:topoisomerase IA-like protein
MPAGVEELDDAAPAPTAPGRKPAKKTAAKKTAAKKTAPNKQAAVLAPALGVPESDVLDKTADLDPE